MREKLIKVLYFVVGEIAKILLLHSSNLGALLIASVVPSWKLNGLNENNAREHLPVLLRILPILGVEGDRDGQPQKEVAHAESGVQRHVVHSVLLVLLVHDALSVLHNDGLLEVLPGVHTQLVIRVDKLRLRLLLVGRLLWHMLLLKLWL